MSPKRWWLILLAAVCLILLSGCASAPRDKGWYSPPVDLRAAQVPPCAFEDPYLPEPCTLEIAPGEKLVVRNAAPEGRGGGEARKHSFWWWLLLSLVTF